MTPQSPRRARGTRRASSQAGHAQKKAGTPHPAPVPMNVNVWPVMEVLSVHSCNGFKPFVLVLVY